MISQYSLFFCLIQVVVFAVNAKNTILSPDEGKNEAQALYHMTPVPIQVLLMKADLGEFTQRQNHGL